MYFLLDEEYTNSEMRCRKRNGYLIKFSEVVKTRSLFAGIIENLFAVRFIKKHVGSLELLRWSID